MLSRHMNGGSTKATQQVREYIQTGQDNLFDIGFDALEQTSHKFLRDLVSHFVGNSLAESPESNGVDITQFTLVSIQHLIGQTVGNLQDLFFVHSREEDTKRLDGNGLNVIGFVM